MADEVDFGVYFLTSVIMDVVVDVYASLRAALYQYYPNQNWDDLPPLLRYASWIGGDRDGNPNVTPNVTFETMRLMRLSALQRHRETVERLSHQLSQSTRQVQVSDELRQSLAGDAALFPQIATLLQPVYRPRVPQSKTCASGLQARIAARSCWTYLSARSSPASMIRKTTKVDQIGSSSAATSQTEKPMQVTRSGRVKRFRRARSGRCAGAAQIA